MMDNKLAVRNYKGIKIEPLKGKDCGYTLDKGYTALNLFFKNIHKFWVSAGTTLGLIRDNNFIPHDTDIDVEVFIQETPQFTLEEIVDFFSNFGFKLVRTQFYGGLPMQIAFIDTKTDIIFDIYFYYEGNMVDILDSDYDIFNRDEHGILCMKKEFIKDMKKYEFIFGKLYMPTPVEDYLKYRYGKDWRTPKNKKDSWENDANNLIR